MSDLVPQVIDEPRYNTIDEAVDALRRGLMVIVVDAAERENEGDFICAAESITAAQVDSDSDFSYEEEGGEGPTFGGASW